MRDQFIEAVEKHQPAFGLDLSSERVERLTDYYDLILLHNPILHLVAPCLAEEFAVRHILESLTLLEYLPENASFADVGTGAGLPAIPCLIVRDDLKAVLIDSKEKKTKLLSQASVVLGLADRVQIVNRQFEEIEGGNFEFVTCRALDKFAKKLPRLLKWAKRRQLLLFGGGNLRAALEKEKIGFTERLVPMSEQRFLFVTLERAKP